MSSWENGKNSIDVEILFKICSILGVSLYDMYGTAPENTDFNLIEKQIISNYRNLTLNGKCFIDHTISELLEYEQLQSRPAPYTANEPPEQYGDNITFIPELMQKICAGTGSIGDDVQFEEKAYPSIKVPSGAEYAACVSGESMEPKYSDGDIVFYKHVDTLVDGEIGIFNINNENYLKRYTKDGLEALNPEYGTIVPSEDDHIQVIGKVLGKL